MFGGLKERLQAARNRLRQQHRRLLLHLLRLSLP